MVVKETGKEEEELAERRRVVFPAQHQGPLTTQQAEDKLRQVWPHHVVTSISVSKTAEFFNKKCGLEHLQIEALLEPGYNYDNYFSRPTHDQHWPREFLPFQICNCKLEESYNV